MFPNPTIRRLVRDDFSLWEPLWHEYLRFYRAGLSEEITRATFDRLADGTSGLVGLVAQGEKELVGLVHLVLHPSTWSSATYCYLEDLFVSPAARGSSVAKALIAASYLEADRRGATRTYWHTQQYNGPARSLYDQVGHLTSFVVYER
ncbi:MAG TPA: GNAT family N-acetyltransferase [Acidimicrobiales bacterium]|nr:GNAT family N-acetyltransferase [Acidimicrobiales bacterium]